jgi:hypothetical protein
MVAQEKRSLHQDAVFWETNLTQNNYGREELKAAVAVKIRWQTKNKEVLSPGGSVIGIESMAVVDRTMPVGSILWLGKLIDLPGTPANLRQVVNYNETPDIKNRKVRRTVDLIKFSNELPDLA